MATAGEMIGVIADAIVRPDATVRSFYGVLRKGGLISTTGRGRSAQHLAPLDVARVLIVMLSADALQEGEAVTRLVGGLRHVRLTSKDEWEPAHDIAFEDAVAHVIAMKAEKMKGRPISDDGALGDITSPVRIRVTATNLSAEIVAQDQTTPFVDLGDSPAGLERPNEWEGVSMEERLLLRAMMGGMSVTREIDDLAIKKIAAAMP